MSLLLYRGPSALDPTSTIRVVASTGRSRNAKTGDMIQIWILRDDMDPRDALRTGQDLAICGMCRFRPFLDGGCYVRVSEAPLSVWRASHDLPLATPGQIWVAFRGRPVRLGAYGDPAAMPAWLVQFLARVSGERFTGYSHSWRGRPDLAPYVMASVHSEAEAEEARAAGFRTFRAGPSNVTPGAGEILCPSERVACADCLLCRGSSLRARSIVIPVHGNQIRKALAVVR